MTTYNIYKMGQITKFEAGVIYKANKLGQVKVMQETISCLYNEVKYEYRLADERYHQDYKYYDRVYDATQAILDGNYDKAQELINAIEEHSIKAAGKKSPYYKYKEV